MPNANALSGSLLLLLLACSGTEPPENVTADIKADGSDSPVTVSANVAVNLSWSSENATSCLVTPGGLSGTTGAATVEGLRVTTTYRLSCTGPGGQAEDTVHIAVTPPGTQIVFQSGDGASAGIYVVNADGTGLTRLSDDAHADFSPSWSGDGRQIYFISSNRDGQETSGLYAMNPDGTDVRLVVANFHSSGGFRQAYAVSPDGTRIALGAYQYPNVDIFVMNADGSERTRIVDLPCDGLDLNCHNLEALAWSPDGQRIAYSTGSRGHGFTLFGVIGVVNADGTGHQYLPTGERSTEPAWAPDGQRIVFSSGPAAATYNPQPIDLEIINPDGTGRMVLVDGDGDRMANTSPSWSPDGQSIAFVRSQTHSWDVVPQHTELFAVNVDGTGLRLVTVVPGGVFAPDWNPRR